jgi:DNA-binding NarL/FixJ family response regulator
MTLRVAVAGGSRWAAEGVAAALREAAGASAVEVRSFDGREALHADSRWPALAVAIVGTREQVAELSAALPADLPVLWLVEPGAAPGLALPDAQRPSGWLHADGDPARWPAALAALARGLSVHDPDLAPRGGAAEPASAATHEPLTARELEVFELMAKGMPNRDIARALGISPHTAKFHVAQILEKTATASRTEAVGYGLRHGLVGV